MGKGQKRAKKMLIASEDWLPSNFTVAPDSVSETTVFRGHLPNDG